MPRYGRTRFWAGMAATAALLAVAVLRYLVVSAWIVAVVVGLIAVVAVMMPRSMSYQPWRLFLPPLVGYTLLSLTLNPTPSDAQQLRLLALFCVGFLLSWIVAFGLPGSGRQQPVEVMRRPLQVALGALVGAEVAGVLIYGAIYSAVGVPLLAGGQAQEVRVELASPGRTAILIVGRALLQIVLVVDILTLFRKVTVTGQRRAGLHVAFVAVVLLSSTGRSDVLIPLVIAFVALLLTGWRKVMPTVAAMFGGGALFLLLGSYRSSGSSNVFAPARNYLVGTAQVGDKIQSTFGNSVPFQRGHVMLWFTSRFTGSAVVPPGIYLKELFNRTGTFVGYGLETNAVGAWYLDYGVAGVAVGGLLMGAVANLVYRRWRTQGGWWAVAYAFVVTWLLLSVAIHPIANYWVVIFPLTLTAWTWANRRLVASHARPVSAERRPQRRRPGTRARGTRSQPPRIRARRPVRAR